MQLPLGPHLTRQEAGETQAYFGANGGTGAAAAFVNLVRYAATEELGNYLGRGLLVHRGNEEQDLLPARLTVNGETQYGVCQLTNGPGYITDTFMQI